jgi:hypothetical protein
MQELCQPLRDHDLRRKAAGKKGFNGTAFQGDGQVIGSHLADASNSGKAANADDSRLKHRLQSWRSAYNILSPAAAYGFPYLPTALINQLTFMVWFVFGALSSAGTIWPLMG